MNRRKFTQAVAAGLGVAALPFDCAAVTHKLKIGYTCITWGCFPGRESGSQALENAVRDVAGLGFYSFETFPEILDYWDAKGALQKLIDQYQLPLKSGYFTTVLLDASKRKESVDRVIKLGKTVTKYGGTFGVIQPESLKRDGYDFKEHRANIIAGLNEHAQALTDLGLTAGLHQHTGTCIETQDEVYDVMNSANTRYLKFAPDVGQLQRGGSDPVQVCKDFLPILKHMHLKDFATGERSGYVPLGMGKVDIPAILDMVEAGGQEPDIMVELDYSTRLGMTPLETAQVSKVYLLKMGYKFRP
jgi:inosose dehydratase